MCVCVYRINALQNDHFGRIAEFISEGVYFLASLLCYTARPQLGRERRERSTGGGVRQQGTYQHNVLLSVYVLKMRGVVISLYQITNKLPSAMLCDLLTMQGIDGFVRYLCIISDHLFVGRIYCKVCNQKCY